MSSIMQSDGVVSFHLGDEIYMHYNIVRQKVIVLAAKPAYNKRLEWPVGQYWFYNFHEDTKHPVKKYMTFETMCSSVLAALKHHNICAPSNTTVTTT